MQVLTNRYSPLAHKQLSQESNALTHSRQIVTVIGCGDIGRRLAQRLPQAQYQVMGIRRRPPEDSANIRYRAADVQDSASLAAALSHHSDVVVITLTPAAYTDSGYRETYVQGTGNLLAQLRRQARPPRLVVYVSSTSVNGQAQGEWVNEDSATQPASFNGQRLLEAERLLQDSELNAVVIRFAGIYGPGRDRLLQRVWRERGVLSGADHYTNRIHADDCGAAIAHLIEQQRLGTALQPLYLGSDSLPVRASEVQHWLARQMDLLAEPVGEPTGDPANTPESEPGAAAGGKRCCNQRLLDSGFSLQYPDYRVGYGELLRAFLQRRAASGECGE
nr:SDR family oxidoreductase [Pseudomaricurvus alcaniphilus]